MKYICENCGKEYNCDVSKGNWDKDNNQVFKRGGVISSQKFCCFQCGTRFYSNKARETNVAKYGDFHQRIDENKALMKLKRFGDKNYSSKRSIHLPNAFVKRICKNCAKEYEINFSFGKVWTKENTQILKGKRAQTVSAYDFCCYECGREFQRKKRSLTNLSRFKVKNSFQTKISKNAILKKLGVQNPFKSKHIQDKIKQTNLEKYGVENPMKMKDVVDKGFETKKRNGSCGRSKAEERIFQKLKTRYNKIERDYMSDLYPYHCDFYIPKEDLYIEYQGWWGHGPNKFHEPFDENKKEHQCELHRLRDKNMKSYELTILNWTIRDPEKRKCAKQNNLNFLEFFTEDDFNKWFENNGL